MFKQARIKLTAFYLLIIMAISISFSAFIYQSVGREFQNRLGIIERRLELRERGFRPPPGQIEFFVEDLAKARERVLIILIYTNGIILALSAGAGYFLAGKTLKPIEEAMERQNRFIADASHELKTPLTALTTTIEVALRDKEIKLAEAREVLGDSLEEVEGLKRLTNDLLSMSKYQSDKRKIVLKKVNIKRVTETAVNRLAALSARKGVKIMNRAQEMTVLGINEELEKLMTILIDNGIKYTPKGGEVAVETERQRKRAVIMVTDNGDGIAKEDLPHIFERFYKGDKARTKSGTDGFGLGLSIAKEIVKRHNGSIGVRSKVGKGTKFTVKLPA